MNFRKLERQEHWKARKLWEQIFKEDAGSFLDYYYTVKTNENEIYVAEDDGSIVAMLHLNPYMLRINKWIHSANYIVAVATDERYRKKGIMSALLKRAMRAMYERNEPFTFLMPAAEAIYYPFDFRFVYRQGQSMIRGMKSTDDVIQIEAATEKDCEGIAEFVNRRLKDYQVVARRDKSYYETLIYEHQSEDGEVLFTKREGIINGVLCYAKDEQIMIREPIFEHHTDFQAAVYSLTGDVSKQVKCIGYGDEECVPMIMARILRLETFLKTLQLKENLELVVGIEDSILNENQGVFHVIGNKENGIHTVERVCGCGTMKDTVKIGTLTSLLFGYLTLEELTEKEELNISSELKNELEKIIPLQKVFLNEMV